MGGSLATLMTPTRWKLRRSTLTPGARVQVRFGVVARSLRGASALAPRSAEAIGAHVRHR